MFRFPSWRALLGAAVVRSFLAAQPVAPTGPVVVAAPIAAEPPRAADATPLVVNTASREEVRQFYRAIYGASDNVPMGWTGDYATGNAGDTSAAFKAAILLRINFFRALAGVPAAVTLNATYSSKDQQAALMMSANNTLQHTGIPTTWTFYTAAGAEAAANSNLALGQTGPDAITGYMRDDGGNNAAVGHRRWLIYPQTQQMGTGDVPGNQNYLAANATWILDDQFGKARPATRTTAVAYPPAGYVPYTLVWPRWSFSYPNADFSAATVTMTRDGQSISAVPEPLSTGVGEPALVWVYNGLDGTSNATHPRPTADTTYTVNIANVRINGASQNFSYTVTVFDPAVASSNAATFAVSGGGSCSGRHGEHVRGGRAGFRQRRGLADLAAFELRQDLWRRGWPRRHHHQHGVFVSGGSIPGRGRRFCRLPSRAPESCLRSELHVAGDVCGDQRQRDRRFPESARLFLQHRVRARSSLHR